jgi:hypothetical protein
MKGGVSRSLTGMYAVWTAFLEEVGVPVVIQFSLLTSAVLGG